VSYEHSTWPLGNVESVVGYSYSQNEGKTNVLKLLQGYQCVTCGSNT